MESSNSVIPEKSISNVQIKTKSAPIVPLKSSELLTVQISAPSYFHSLKENEAPPFRKPEKEPKPHLLIGIIVTEDDVVEMIAAADSDEGWCKHLGKYLVNKKIVANYNLTERTFLINFLKETIDYAAQRDFPAFKLACLLTIYLSTHLYFKFYYWISPIAVWQYFKEIMIRHSIQDSPDGQEIFLPEECYDILSHFHTIYLSNIALVHILTFGVHRLKFMWPFKPK